MNASEARQATDAAVRAYESPIVDRALREIREAIADAANKRLYSTLVTDMGYAHTVSSEVVEALKHDGYDVQYRHTSMRKTCPSGYYAYRIAW